MKRRVFTRRAAAQLLDRKAMEYFIVGAHEADDIACRWESFSFFS